MGQDCAFAQHSCPLEHLDRGHAPLLQSARDLTLFFGHMDVQLQVHLLRQPRSDGFSRSPRHMRGASRNYEELIRFESDRAASPMALPSGGRKC